MKVLKKSTVRLAVKNKSFYISGILLTALAVMIFLAEISAGNTVGKRYKDFMQEMRVEDAEFTVMYPLGDDDIEKLEKDYTLDIERQHYLDAEETDFVLRLFEPTDKINLYHVTEGTDITENGQILLSGNFAEANNLKIGDSIDLQGKSFEICGFAERPDYLYMVRNSGDIFHSNATFGLGILSRDDMESLGTVTEIYAVSFSDSDNSKDITSFRKQLYDDYMTLSYTSADNNLRITKPAEISESCYSSGYSMIAVMCILVMIIISLILGRIVKRESKQIGTLSAFGYRKYEIKLHYMLYGIITGLLGSIFGFVLSFATLKYLLKYSISQLEYISFKSDLDIPAVIICFIMPTLLYGLTAYLTAGRLLAKNEVVELLTNRFEENKKGNSAFVKNSKKRISRIFKLRTLIANKKRTVIALIGLLFGSICIMFGFSMYNTIHDFLEHGFDEMGTYRYQYFLSEPQFSDTGDLQNGEAMNAIGLEMTDSEKLVNIYGVDKYNSLVNLSMTDDGTFSEDNYYITSITAKLYGVKVGDTVSLRNPMSLENVDIEISGVISNNVTVGIFTGRENVCELLGVENKSYYNIIVSENKLNNEEDLAVYTVISKDALKEQMGDAVNTLNSMIYMIVLFGILICIIFVYICINQIITENLLNVSMFKVLGYRDKEINKMLLTPYHIFVPISLLISIPTAKALSQQMWNMYAGMYNFQATAKLYISSIIISAVIFVASYVVSLFLLRKKVFQADMVEVLKDNRE